MNDFALNDGELDGQQEVWLDVDSPSQFSLSLTGDFNKARFIQSLASVQFSSSLKAAIRVGLQSASGYGLTVSAWLPPSVRKELAGGASERVQASGEVLRQAKLNGLSEVDLLLSGDIKAFGLPRCLFELKIEAQAEARISRSVQVDCVPAKIFVDAESAERVTPATMIESRVQHWLHALGSLKRDSYSSTGTARVQIVGSGDLGKGAKVKLEGTASVFVELYSRGILGGIRYRYLSGEAALSLLSSWSPTGHPQQPDFYIPAQDERVLYAIRDDRTLVVPREVA